MERTLHSASEKFEIIELVDQSSPCDLDPR